MSQKPPLPAPPARIPAAHVQTAVARAAQARMPERASIPAPPRAASPVAQPAPAAVRPVAPHVQSALGRSPQMGHARPSPASTAQAKAAAPPPPHRPPAPHVQAAQAAVQRSPAPAPPRPPRPPAPPAPRAGGAIQRMIVVASPDPNDYAVVKVASQLMRYEWDQGRSGRLHTLGPSTHFSKIKKDEPLFIIGHGARETGEIKGITSKQLIKYLNDENTGIPKHAGKIVILTCFSGEDIGDEEDSSLADKVAQGLKHKNIKVYGAKGFAYGSPQTQETGFNSVLSREHIAFYESSDVNKIADALAEIRPSKDIILEIPEVGARKIKSGQRIGDIVKIEPLRKWAAEFKKKRDSIEKRMKEIVGGTGENYMALATRKVMKNEEFQELVKDQYKLFNEFLFTPPEDAYKLATS